MLFYDHGNNMYACIQSVCVCGGGGGHGHPISF